MIKSGDRTFVWQESGQFSINTTYRNWIKVISWIFPVWNTPLRGKGWGGWFDCSKIARILKAIIDLSVPDVFGGFPIQYAMNSKKKTFFTWHLVVYTFIWANYQNSKTSPNQWFPNQWVIICYLPPFTGTWKIHWPKGILGRFPF